MKQSTPIAVLLVVAELGAALGNRLAAQGPAPSPVPVPGGGVIQRLQASDRAAGDLFACALSLSGPTLLAGSLLDDDRGSASGAAYVFDLGSDGWSQTAKLLGADTAAGDQLGFSVDLSSDEGSERALIGAPLAGVGGVAYRFDRVGGVDGAWRQTARWDGGEARADFGSAVAFAPGRALVGAPLADAGGRPDAGAVFVFSLDGRGSPARLEARSPQAAAGLGWAVAGTAEVVAAGAPWADSPLTGAGMVVLFAAGPDRFRPLADVTAPDAGAFDAFGYSLDVAGDLLVVGAPLDDDRGTSAGAVYVFRLRDGRAVLETKIPGTVPGDQYGTTVAITADGRRFAVGARRGDGTAGADVGYVDVFDRVGDHWESELRIQPDAARAGDEVGIDVSLSGAGVAVGAYKDDGGGADAGAAYVLTPAADLALTKRLESADPAAGPAAVSPAPGEQVVFVVEVENRGPGNAFGARVLDAPPEGLEDVTWTCAASGGARCAVGSPSGSGGPGGKGAIDDRVDLPAGGRVVYRMTGTVGQGVTGDLVNLASVEAPSGIFDPVPGNGADQAEVSVGLPRSDLALALRFLSGAAAIPGRRVLHEVEIANLGPSDAPTLRLLRGGLGSAFLDPVWTCRTVQIGGSGTCVVDPNDPEAVGRFTLAAGGRAAFRLDALIDPGARGELVLAGDLGPLAGIDPDPSNNADSVSTPLEPVSDLGITLSPVPPTSVPVTGGGGPVARRSPAPRQAEGAIDLQPGETIVYTVRVGNDGPSDAFGGRVRAFLPAGLEGAGWTCAGDGGAVCAPSGAGTLDDLPNLPVGSTAVYSVAAAAAPGFLGRRAVAVSIEPPGALFDPDPSDNRAVDPGPVLLPMEGIAVTLDAQGSFAEGSLMTYEILIANSLTTSYSDFTGDELTLPLPPQLDPVAVTADVGEVQIASPPAVVWNGPVASVEVVTIRLTARIAPGTRGTEVSTQADFQLLPAAFFLQSSPPGMLQPAPTSFLVSGPLEIPTVSPWGLALLALLLGASALGHLRPRRTP